MKGKQCCVSPTTLDDDDGRGRSPWARKYAAEAAKAWMELLLYVADMWAWR